MFQAGSWSFEITGNYWDKVDVMVTSKAAFNDVDPLLVIPGISNTDARHKHPIVVYAKVNAFSLNDMSVYNKSQSLF